MPDEHRGHRATRDGRRQRDPAILEVKLDHVPPQRQVVHDRKAIATRRQLSQLLEDGLVALGGRLRGQADGEQEQNERGQTVSRHTAHPEEGCLDNAPGADR